MFGIISLHLMSLRILFQLKNKLKEKFVLFWRKRLSFEEGVKKYKLIS